MPSPILSLGYCMSFLSWLFFVLLSISQVSILPGTKVVIESILVCFTYLPTKADVKKARHLR